MPFGTRCIRQPPDVRSRGSGVQLCLTRRAWPTRVTRSSDPGATRSLRHRCEVGSTRRRPSGQDLEPLVAVGLTSSPARPGSSIGEVVQHELGLGLGDGGDAHATPVEEGIEVPLGRLRIVRIDTQ